MVVGELWCSPIKVAGDHGDNPGWRLDLVLMIEQGLHRALEGPTEVAKAEEMCKAIEQEVSEENMATDQVWLQRDLRTWTCVKDTTLQGWNVFLPISLLCLYMLNGWKRWLQAVILIYPMDIKSDHGRGELEEWR
jgi:hypothetical protein